MSYFLVFQHTKKGIQHTKTYYIKKNKLKLKKIVAS